MQCDAAGGFEFELILQALAVAGFDGAAKIKQREVVQQNHVNTHDFQQLPKLLQRIDLKLHERCVPRRGGLLSGALRLARTLDTTRIARA